MGENTQVAPQGKSTIMKIPTITELVEEYSKPESEAERTLVALLNCNPPEKWLLPHPTATRKNEKGEKVPCKYLPTDKIEYLLSRTFTRWWLEILDYKLIANSVGVSVRLYVINPITGQQMHNDGIGAVAIQTDSGAGAIDWSKVKSAGVQMALPAAETYAFKDAAEKFGRLFGKDVNRNSLLEYNDMLKSREFVV